MKLNLIIETADPKEDIVGYKSFAKYSPIGWWKVTTEGDCEGRTINTIGTFYGHVAEIAFANRLQSGYSLCFEPILSKTMPTERRPRTIFVGDKEKEISVHISFTCRMTSGYKPMHKAVAAWLDADDVIVTDSNYHSAIKLTMRV